MSPWGKLTSLATRHRATATRRSDVTISGHDRRRPVPLCTADPRLETSDERRVVGDGRFLSHLGVMIDE